MLNDQIKIYKEYSELNKSYLKEKNIYPLPRELFREKQSEILLNILDFSSQYIGEEYYIENNFYKKMAKNISILSQESQPH